jgi:hypothetical protein
MKHNAPKNDEWKFREMLVYIAARSENDETVGSVKLNKLLFNADFISYGLFGKAISGVEYQRLQKGPAPRRMVPVTTELVKQGVIARGKRTWMGVEQHRIYALREPDVSAFTAQELDILNQVITQNWGLSGNTMSRISHEFLGWKAANEGETIPYHAIFLSDRALTPEEAEFALELARKARRGTKA